MATPIINEIGTDEQKDEFLAPALARRQDRGARRQRADCGSDVATIRTTARKVGDDYVINGAKCWITNGTRADFITLAVRTGGDGLRRHLAGALPHRRQGLQGHARSSTRWATTPRTPPSSPSRTAASRARYLLGEENHGFYYIMTNFQGERLIAAVNAVAGAQCGARRHDPLRHRSARRSAARSEVPGVAPQVRRAR